MVEALAARLREDVELDSLKKDIHDVVTEAVSPSSTQLWVPPARGSIHR